MQIYVNFMSVKKMSVDFMKQKKQIHWASKMVQLVRPLPSIRTGPERTHLEERERTPELFL